LCGKGLKKEVEKLTSRAALIFEVAAGRRKHTKVVIVLCMMNGCGKVRMLLVEGGCFLGKG
jgi:hypothetical protein